MSGVGRGVCNSICVSPCYVASTCITKYLYLSTPHIAILHRTPNVTSKERKTALMSLSKDLAWNRAQEEGVNVI